MSGVESLQQLRETLLSIVKEPKVATVVAVASLVLLIFGRICWQVGFWLDWFPVALVGLFVVFVVSATATGYDVVKYWRQARATIRYLGRLSADEKQTLRHYINSANRTLSFMAGDQDRTACASAGFWHQLRTRWGTSKTMALSSTQSICVLFGIFKSTPSCWIRSESNMTGYLL